MKSLLLKVMFMCIVMCSVMLAGCTAVSSTVINIEVNNKSDQQKIYDNFSLFAKENKLVFDNRSSDKIKVFTDVFGDLSYAIVNKEEEIEITYTTYPVRLFPYPKIAWEHRKFQNILLKEFSQYKNKYKVSAVWSGNRAYYPNDYPLSLPPPAWKSLIIFIGENFYFVLVSIIGLIFLFHGWKKKKTNK